MYDELIKMLRTCSERDSCIGWEKACPYLRTGFCNNKAEKAADAIEDLQKQLQKSEVYNINLTGWLAEEHAKSQWIPVKERLPEKDQEVLIFLFGEDPYIAWHNGEYWCTEDFRLDKPDDWQPTYWFPLPQPPKEE